MANPSGSKVLVSGRTFVLLSEKECDRISRVLEGPGADAGTLSDQEIGKDLRLRRRNAGLTQAEVARRAGIRLETLSRLENGRSNSTVATLRAILRALGEVGPT